VPGARRIEVEFFRMLNRVVEPRIRAGLGSPCLTPGGFIVLETRGRVTRRLARTPLAATRIQDHVVVGTFRGGRSLWVKNLAADPETRFWIGGRARAARATVVQSGERARDVASLPTALRWVVSFLRPYTYAGWAFAVLAPRPRSDRARAPRRTRSEDVQTRKRALGGSHA
jgi:deazaflavin-dependent oxidoreductase (nitroreductase family)